MIFQVLKNAGLSLVVFLSLDSIWLGLIAKNFYDKHLSPFPRTFNLPAAVFAYILLALGTSFFILDKPNIIPLQGLTGGALLEPVVYGFMTQQTLQSYRDGP